MAKPVKLPNGVEYNFAGVGFSNDAVSVIELLEDADAAKEAGQPFAKYGKLLRGLRNLMLESLKKGGHTTEDAEAGVSSLPLDSGIDQYLGEIRASMGLD